MGGRNASINSETLKEISDALEEVKESVIARTDTVRSLSYYTPESEGWGLMRKAGRTERITSIPTKIAFAGGKGSWRRGLKPVQRK